MKAGERFSFRKYLALRSERDGRIEYVKIETVLVSPGLQSRVVDKRILAQILSRLRESRPLNASLRTKSNGTEDSHEDRARKERT